MNHFQDTIRLSKYLDFLAVKIFFFFVCVCVYVHFAFWNVDISLHCSMAVELKQEEFWKKDQYNLLASQFIIHLYKI